MGKRRAATVVLASAAISFVAVPAVASGGGGIPTKAAPSAVTLPTTPPVALPGLTAPAVPCTPSELRVTQLGVKVALGTVVGTYGVETDGCSLAVDDHDLLTTIDGGVPPLDAVLRQPGVLDITYRNPNVQAPPIPGVPPLPPVTAPLPQVPPITVPPVTIPNNPALQPVTAAANSVRDQANAALSNVRNLLSPTTAAPSPPPPPPPPPDTGPTTYPSGATGFDISWPQCGNGYPPSSSVAVVGVNDGRTFTTNPCLASEYSWAGGARELYMNLNSPSAVDSTDSSGPAGQCGSDRACMAYNYGYNAAVWSYDNAASHGVRAKTWWLDVEVVGNCAPQFPTGGQGYWSCGQGLNTQTVQGALDALRQRGLVAGIYSTSYQWGQITGSANPTGGAPPNWLAGASSSSRGSWCSGSHNFAGGPAWLLQYSPQTWDRDQAC